MSDIFPSKIMNPICEQAGCDDKLASKHAWKWEQKRWHAHPSRAFTAWWRPDHFDELSSAHVGGHPDAHRRWARKDADGWLHRWYGISCLNAWNMACYVEEFDAWENLGSPEGEPFISIALPLKRQQQFWHDLKGIIDKGAKPMPKVTEGDIALEATVARTMPDP